MLTEKNSFSFFLLRLVTSFAILLQSTHSFSPDRRFSCVLFVRFVCLSLVSFASYPKNALFFCVCAISWFGEFGRLPPSSMSLSALVVATLKLISVPLNCKLFLSLFSVFISTLSYTARVSDLRWKSRVSLVASQEITENLYRLLNEPKPHLKPASKRSSPIITKLGETNTFGPTHKWN